MPAKTATKTTRAKAPRRVVRKRAPKTAGPTATAPAPKKKAVRKVTRTKTAPKNYRPDHVLVDSWDAPNMPPLLHEVRVYEYPAQKGGKAGFLVVPTFTLDGQPHEGVSVVVKDMSIAERLVDAILDGAAYHSAQVKPLAEGDGSYVSCRPNVNGRRMNADLQRLGY